MIITRTPFRVTLGGGGTDLPHYYSQFGGYVVTAAINKCIYVAVQRWFEDGIKVNYTKTEIVDSVDKIQHPVVRESLKFMGINSNIEVLSMADLPSRTGLGSSGSYTVGLLHCFQTYKRQSISMKELAELACHIQMNILKEPCGKQDQYIAAFGGVICLDIDKKGNVTVTPLRISPDTLEQLENNLLYFYTGIRRSSIEIQSKYGSSIQRGEEKVVSSLHRIKEIGYEIKRALEKGDLDAFGELMHAHWEAKKHLSQDISNDKIDLWHRSALKAGAIGGKLMGAGGGGFFMFYCPNDKKNSVRKTMIKLGLREVKFRFEFEGSKVMINV